MSETRTTYEGVWAKQSERRVKPDSPNLQQRVRRDHESTTSKTECSNLWLEQKGKITKMQQDGNTYI